MVVVVYCLREELLIWRVSSVISRPAGR
ncbi:hypothetical protein TSAR_016763 [Trichomalopsis sarcophagae]|uniref:Uncharacterized protein n=1 Tax=Trichomalopsis sarcophagae TaxID=543379 RepID=A0A232EZC0_9HYME|nr:hypothetical protein TSAR_016763 [Trichomalopsis sarcophagae]